MGSLFGALNNSLSAMEAYQNAMDVAQNNVSNASTPGYAGQTSTFLADPLNLSGGQDGGVSSGPTQSTDSRFADQAVQAQMSQEGSYTAQNTALSSIQTLFDVTGQTGVIGALNNLLTSFSAWANDPSTTSNAQAVLSQASQLTEQFNSAASSLSQITTQIDQQISSTVQQINSLASQIATDNQALAQSRPPDPGIQANLESSIESLSTLANTSVIYAPTGTATVMLGGQAALVVGSQANAISANFAKSSAGGNPNVCQTLRFWMRAATTSPASSRRARWEAC